jgi:hypothetical protein
MKTNVHTRRNVLRLGGYGLFAAAAVSGGDEGLSTHVPKWSRPDCTLLCVSPDSKWVFVWLTRSPSESFLVGPGGSQHLSVDRSEDSFQVVNTVSGRVISTVHLRGSPLHSSAFADNRHIFVSTGPIGETKTPPKQEALISSETGAILEDRLEPWKPGTIRTALKGRTLLCEEWKTGRLEALTQVEFPSLRELRTCAPYDFTKRVENGQDRQVIVSADRSKLIYASDRTMFCRDAETLDLLWTRANTPGFTYPLRPALSTQGDYAAVALVDTMFRDLQRNYCIEVLSGTDGTLIAKLPLNGIERVAISPDGKTLAVGERVERPNAARDCTLAVSLVDVATGKRLARLVHDRFQIKPHESLNSHFGGLEFAVDGRYLISSSTKLCVWDMRSISYWRKVD